MTRVILVGDSHLARLGAAPDGLAAGGHAVVNAAAGGAGAGDLIAQVRDAAPAGDDVLVVSVGTADAMPDHPLPLDAFADALRDLLDEVDAARTVLVVPPGMEEGRVAGDGEGANRGVTAYAERAAALFGSAGARVVEAWVLLAPLQERAYAADGLHLSDAAYDVLLPAVREAIDAVLAPA